jgi:hypothetical protein
VAIEGIGKSPLPTTCPEGSQYDSYPAEVKQEVAGRLSKSLGRGSGYIMGKPSMSETSRLQRVLDQLRLYEHPLLDFGAQQNGEAVDILINFRHPAVPVHTYYFTMHPRDLDHPQFEWTFQRQLYDCLHDYLIEMFTRTPQSRERRQEGL